jgi:5-methylthioadenosine/S-adenosylhomocysteine deaminase
MDDAIGEFEQGAVLVEGDRIAEVAPSLDAPGAERIDARGTVAMPGFVDTHRHT